MTEQELIEKIVDYLDDELGAEHLTSPARGRRLAYKWADEILALIKEAGY